MSMIPNPKKDITIDFTLEEVKAAVKGIPAYTLQKYKMHEVNDVFNQYVLSALELLSLGVFIDINLKAVSETRTEVVIEVRRKLGAFDQWFEVDRANEHIAALTRVLTHLLQHGREPEKYPLPKAPTAAEKQVAKRKEWNTNWIIIGSVLFIVLGLMVWSRYKEGVRQAERMKIEKEQH